MLGSIINTVGNWLGANYQNRYNSPKEQMARFREAGLNPNLIYTQGNSGNMTTQPGVNIAEPTTRHQKLMQHQEYKMSEADLAIKHQEVNNMKTQNDINIVKYNDDKARFDAMFTPVNDFGLNLPNAYFLNPRLQAWNLFHGGRMGDYEYNIYNPLKSASLVSQNALRDYQREVMYPEQLKNASRQINIGFGNLSLARDRFNFEKSKYDPLYENALRVHSIDKMQNDIVNWGRDAIRFQDYIDDRENMPGWLRFLINLRQLK